MLKERSSERQRRERIDSLRERGKEIVRKRDERWREMETRERVTDRRDS